MEGDIEIGKTLLLPDENQMEEMKLVISCAKTQNGTKK